MRIRTAVAAGTVLGVTALSAHDLFIKLESYFVEPDALVRVPVLNGTFQVSENSITRDRVTDISVVSHAGREHVDTTAWLAEGDTTVLTIQTGDAGTYVVGASTRPRELDLAAADFNDYLEHDGIPDVLEARRRDGELEQDVRERYGKHVKAAIQVGERRRWWQFWRGRDEAYLTPFGYPAEIVPLVDPYAIAVGGTMRVRCLVDGEPVANQLVISGGENADGPFTERAVRTDAEGVAEFMVDVPGSWYVKFIHMAPSADDSVDYESKWATLTFGVR